MSDDDIWSEEEEERPGPTEMVANGGRPVTCSLHVPFPDSRTAEIALSSLQVDKEPPRSNVRRRLSVEGCDLVAEFEGPELKKLRTSMNSFVDHVHLVLRTIEQFDVRQ